MARPGPNLFIVGAPRCGTSAMFRLLAQHPAVSVSDPKEPYYFCTDFHEESDRFHGKVLRFPLRREAQYLALFGDLSRAVVAEATPAYLYSKVAAARIHAFNPDARILVMVREPLDLLRSLHAKMLSYGQEDLPDLHMALEAEPARRNGQQLPTGLFWPSSLYYSEWVRLGEQIERYRKLFPANQVKVVVYDDFRRDNPATYADVLTFLGLDASFVPEFRQYNENKAVRFRLLSKVMGVAGDLSLKHLVPGRAHQRLRRALRRANLKPAARARLDPDVRRELMARFRPDVEALSRVLNRDLLTLWGYA